MNNEGLINKLFSLISPIVTNLEYELYHIEFVKEDNENYLRIYIDTENGISLTDCEKVSRAISEMLDIEDPVPTSYYLEVSSPGINRYLYTDAHLTKYKGSNVRIDLKSLLNGNNFMVGTLTDYNDKEITILSNNEEIAIERQKINSINLEGDI